MFAPSADTPFPTRSEDNRHDDGCEAPAGAVRAAMWVGETYPPLRRSFSDCVIANMGSDTFSGATNTRTAANLVAANSMTGAVTSEGIVATGATPTSGAAIMMGEAVTRVSAARKGASMGAIPTPTPTPFTNCTIVLFVRLVLVSSFFNLFVLLLVLHWTRWLSVYYEKILTGSILDFCASLPLLGILRLSNCDSALLFFYAGLGLCLLM